MATLIPAYSVIDKDALPRSERRVLDILHDLEFPGLEVYFSLPLVRERKQGTYRSEADFILFHPHHGVLVWEVKGGGISLNNSQWFTTNATGTYPIKDPIKQADNAIGALISRKDTKVSKALAFPIGRNLVFPDTEAERIRLPLGLVRQDILDHRDLKQLTVDHLKAQFARWPKQESLPIDKLSADRLRRRVLNPTFNLAPSIDAQVDQVESRLVQLTNQQIWALELLRFVPRLTITGGAGTGKTLLARHKTMELVEDGRRVLTLCFNKGLAAHLQESLAELRAEYPEQLTVGSFHDFARHQLEPEGFRWQPPSEPDAQRRFYEETVPLELENHAIKAVKYDALVVDEAQDFHPLWWMALEPFLAENAGIYLFADPAQNLYGREFEIPTDVFEGMVPHPFHLAENCRNSREIAQWLSERFDFASNASPLLPESGYDVTEIRWRHVNEQTKALTSAWNTLQQQGVDPKQLVILSPYRPENSGGIKALTEAFPDVGFSSSSINAFKGLQAPFVFLVDMDTGDFAAREDLWYVGATRSTVALFTFAKARN